MKWIVIFIFVAAVLSMLIGNISDRYGKYRADTPSALFYLLGIFLILLDFMVIMLWGIARLMLS